jgi:hypothetical protein
MSTDDDAGPAARLVDAVTPSYVGRPDTEMHAVGLLLAGLLFIGLLPLLPLIAVYVLATRVADFLRRQAGDGTA